MAGEGLALMAPTAETALQFVIMLKAGMPSSEAIIYFLPEDTPQEEVFKLHNKWMRSKEVSKAHHNYSDLNGAEGQKADTCRQVLETKLAGLSGKMDAMSRFMEDVVNKKVRLASLTN